MSSTIKLLTTACFLGSAVAVPIQDLEARQQPFKFYCRVLPNLVAPNDFLENRPLVADGGKFYLGGATSSSNPQNPTVYIGSPNACSLDVGVAGGQLVYVAPDLSIGYTSPHSAATPAGSVSCLDVQRDSNPGSQSLSLWTTRFGSNGFMACPVNDRWKLYAQQWNGPNAEGSSMGCIWMDLACQYYLDQSTASAYEY